VIQLRSVRKTYKIGEVLTKALDNIDLDIYPGEFLAIMGKSGSGKSTLLNQIGLIDEPDSGDIIYNGKNIVELDEETKNEFRLRNFGFVFQDYILFPELTVIENVCLPAIAMGLSLDKSKTKALSILKILNMEHKVLNRPYQLSGGEKQRVAIARAIINNPLVVLCDEPTANLDSKNSKEVLSYLREINIKFNKTVVMVTHDKEETKYADRVIYLEDGRIIRTEIINRARFNIVLKKKNSTFIQDKIENIIRYFNLKNNLKKPNLQRLLYYYKSLCSLYDMLDIKEKKNYHRDILRVYSILKKIRASK